MDKTCPQCGKAFVDSKHPHKKYCSRECWDAALYAKSYETRICPGCGISFEARKGATQKYCNAKCGFKNRPHRRGNPAKRGTFVCEWCGKEFTNWTYRNPRFCSHQCTSEFGARQPKGNRKHKVEYVKCICERCGKQYKLSKAYLAIRNSRFCSAECRDNANSERMRGEGNPNYISGIQYNRRGPNWKKQRRKVLRRDGFKCQRCGKKGNSSLILDVHHIIPYRIFEGDYKKANRLSNLITLCRRCHRLVEYHGEPCPQTLL